MPSVNSCVLFHSVCGSPFVELSNRMDALQDDQQQQHADGQALKELLLTTPLRDLLPEKKIVTVKMSTSTKEALQVRPQSIITSSFTLQSINREAKREREVRERDLVFPPPPKTILWLLSYLFSKQHQSFIFKKNKQKKAAHQT